MARAIIAWAVECWLKDAFAHFGRMGTFIARAVIRGDRKEVGRPFCQIRQLIAYNLPHGDSRLHTPHSRGRMENPIRESWSQV